MSRLLTCLAVLCLFGLAAAQAAAQEKRTWTDKTGKFKIEATLKQVAGGKATLVKADGKEVVIEVTKLSAADQKFLRDNPPGEEEENPFKEADPSPSTPAAPPKQAKVDWADVTQIALSPASDEWKFAPPGGTKQAPQKNRAIALPQKANFFEGVQGLAVNNGRTRAVVGYAMDEPKPTGTTRIVLCDFEQGKILMKATTEGKLAPVALSDDGTQVLMRRAEFGFGNADRLELWKLSPQGVEKKLVFVPYEAENGGGKDIKWGAFLEDGRYLTLGGSGKLALWKAGSAEPIAALQIDGGCGPAISADRKYVAFSTGKQLGILDIEKQEVAALTATPQTPWPQLAFSPDDSQIACMCHGKLLVWNFADGKLVKDIPLAGLHLGTSEIVWPHPKYMLLSKTKLFDIENQVPLWTYNGAEAVAAVGPSQCAFVVSQGHNAPGALVVGPVPTKAFETALAAAQKQPDFFVLKQGTTVKLSLQSLQDAQEREKVREDLTAKLQERGCKVGDNGTIELVATAEAGEERDISYHGFGIGFKTYKVREYISKLAFQYQGKVAWQTQGSSVPGFISLKQGETVEQVLRRSERPNYSFFSNVELPKVLIKPTDANGLGQSKVGVTGVE
jgi:hypothetical protein